MLHYEKVILQSMSSLILSSQTQFKTNHIKMPEFKTNEQMFIYFHNNSYILITTLFKIYTNSQDILLTIRGH